MGAVYNYSDGKLNTQQVNNGDLYKLVQATAETCSPL